MPSLEDDCALLYRASRMRNVMISAHVGAMVAAPVVIGRSGILRAKQNGYANQSAARIA
jgi:hypothetical protein